MISLKDFKDKLEKGEIDPQSAVDEADRKTQIRSGAAMNNRVYRPKSQEDRIKQYDQDEELRKRAEQAKIPFISDETGFFLQPGPVLIGGVSGRGKSTTVANLLAGLIQTRPGKSATVITNEELAGSVLNRVACILMGLSFFDYQNGRMPPKNADAVRKAAKALTKDIDVVSDNAWDMSCMEDVQAVLEYAAETASGLVILDYWQTVAFSKTRPQLESYQVLKLLGLYIKDYGRRVTVPIAILAQSRESEGIDFKERIENDKTIYNHCFMALEIVPDFEAKRSTFICHKDRLGDANGRKIVMEYRNGRFEAISEGI